MTRSRVCIDIYEGMDFWVFGFLYSEPYIYVAVNMYNQVICILPEIFR